ncbi:hypothetical protein PsYK624_132420 [Phanerochaete sordida]|uniref:Uncharacterized protein n=1 Tax=Phanerochaete sordida TaxID=48140 RepID=A0A9P3LK97_9APHY|nr:hypothetical protein PsYK624_132420 [Phanerochaete sordida]
MNPCASTLPSETISAIVTIVSIQHIDDLIRGPLAPHNIATMCTLPQTRPFLSSDQASRSGKPLSRCCLTSWTSGWCRKMLGDSPPGRGRSSIPSAITARPSLQSSRPSPRPKTALLDGCGASAVPRMCVAPPMLVRINEHLLHSTGRTASCCHHDCVPGAAGGWDSCRAGRPGRSAGAGFGESGVVRASTSGL